MVTGLGMNLEKGMMDLLCYQPFLMPNATQRPMQVSSSLGGYFRAIFDKDQPLWEEQLDALIEDTKLKIAIPELTHRYSRSDRSSGLAYSQSCYEWHH